MVGILVGLAAGPTVGAPVGFKWKLQHQPGQLASEVGPAVRAPVGFLAGAAVGFPARMPIGASVVLAAGASAGFTVMSLVRPADETSVRVAAGPVIGKPAETVVGFTVGLAVGDAVVVSVGSLDGPTERASVRTVMRVLTELMARALLLESWLDSRKDLPLVNQLDFRWGSQVDCRLEHRQDL